MSEPKKCECYSCRVEIPSIKRIKAVLPEDLQKEFETLIGNYYHEQMDHDVAEAKLDGSWPRWEWIKDEKSKRGL